MGIVYEKFGIIGDSRGKENRLRIFLKQRYDHQQESQSFFKTHSFSKNLNNENKSVSQLKDRIKELFKTLNQKISETQKRRRVLSQYHNPGCSNYSSSLF